MANSNSLNNLFSRKRISFAIALCLLIFGYLLYRSLNQEQFIVTTQNATHQWVDTNLNKTIDEGEMVLSDNGNYRKVKVTEALSQLSFTFKTIAWLIVAFLFVALRDLAYMYRVRVFMHNQLTFKRSFITIMLWEFASALSPGVVGGSAVAMFILKREGVALGRSTAIIIVSTLMDNLFFVLMIPFVLMFISLDTMFGTDAVWMKSLFWSGYLIIVFICILLIASIFIYPKLIGKVLLFFTRIKWFKKWRTNARVFSEEIQITAKVMQQEKAVYWIKTFISTCVAWIARYLIINAIVMAFISVNFLNHILLLAKQLILWLLMLVSPTPGASGIAEFAFSELLAPFSNSLLLLTCLAIIWRLISYFPYLFIGAFIIPRWLKNKTVT